LYYWEIERSLLTDNQEFYWLLESKDDIDLEKKFAIWEKFCDFQRPHGTHNGKTPYEIIRKKLAQSRKNALSFLLSRGLIYHLIESLTPFFLIS